MARRGRKPGMHLMPDDEKKHMTAFSLDWDHTQLLNDERLRGKKSLFVRFIFDSFLLNCEKDPKLVDKVAAKLFGPDGV